MFSSLCVSLFVCLLATLHKNFQMDLREIFTEGWQWASEQMVKFWWPSGSGIWIRIVTLVRRPWWMHALSQCFYFEIYVFVD